VFPRLQPFRLPHADAVGRRPAQRGLLRRPARPALPPAGPGTASSHLAAQTDDPDSPLNRVRRLIRLRRETPALRTGAPTEVLTRGYPFSYLRGGSHLVVVNPGRDRVTARPQALHGRTVTPLEVSGVRVDDGEIDADGFGYGVFALA
jgi:maltose alpha-D-glucosyltransferase / alpha-amylase